MYSAYFHTQLSICPFLFERRSLLYILHMSLLLVWGTANIFPYFVAYTVSTLTVSFNKEMFST